MKMPQKLAESLQWRLAEYLPIDCMYPIDIFFDIDQEIVSVEVRWQIAVDLIYRLLVAGLICLGGNTRSSGDPRFDEQILSFCNDLAKARPAGGEASIINASSGESWYRFDLCATKKNKELLQKHGLCWRKDVALPFNSNFIDEIEAIFEAGGVPWGDRPLIPISVVAN